VVQDVGLGGEQGSGERLARVRYTHVARTAEALGWAWSYWQFDSDFIVYDLTPDEWVRPIWRSCPGVTSQLFLSVMP
jgi:endoglucanase